MIATNQVSDLESQNQEKIEVIVYDIVSKTFRLNTEYNRNNCRPNAKDIAEKFGCELEFRVSELPDSSYEKLIRGETPLKDRFEIWKVWDIARKGITGRVVRAKSLVLKGENYSQLMKATQEIYKVYGEGVFNNGAVYPMPENYVLGEHPRTHRFN